ncbi:MAG: hypothetical protein DLM61_24440 [Pseudonocardiales bacterium]|nr:hypothetical protein [Pseudonocardiales bacterium]PZS23178.1 MAG: hypothetical protein DLM61_24440 [Pseudonocardiales bacterium]
MADAAEVDGLRDRHLAYYLAFAEAAEPRVLGAGRGDRIFLGSGGVLDWLTVSSSGTSITHRSPSRNTRTA